MMKGAMVIEERGVFAYGNREASEIQVCRMDISAAHAWRTHSQVRTDVAYLISDVRPVSGCTSGGRLGQFVRNSV